MTTVPGHGFGHARPRTKKVTLRPASAELDVLRSIKSSVQRENNNGDLCGFWSVASPHGCLLCAENAQFHRPFHISYDLALVEISVLHNSSALVLPQSDLVAHSYRPFALLL